MNRIEPLMERLGNNPRSNMFLLLNKLSPGGIVPQPDKYYTFVYTPKTRNIRYDMNPFIKCTSIHKWGFVGFNYHWDEHRRYTWQEVATNIFEIYEDEVEDMRNFKTAFFRNS